MFFASPLLTLALTVPEASALDRVRRLTDSCKSVEDSNTFGAEIVDVEGAVGSVTVQIASDTGSETLSLLESDTRLHGSAAIAALPSTDARITLTVYDTAAASLMSFSGTLAADGSVSITSDDAGCDPSDRATCNPAAAPDLEVLAAEVFVGAAGGYDVAFDLNGADAYDAAYADIRITESTEVTTCEKGGGCTTTGGTTTTEAEVYWDDISAVWEAEASLPHEGVIEVKASAWDSRGKKLETVTTKLGARWLDSGAGVNALATDEDPLTVLALGIRGPTWDEPMEVPFVAVVSEGWTASSAPVSASVELTNGGTVTIPVNSYQVAGGPYTIKHPFEAIVISHRITVNGGVFSVNGVTELRSDELASPLCADGVCVVWQEDASGGAGLAVSAYASTASALPTDVAVEITHFEDGIEVGFQADTVTFSDDVVAVFASEIQLSGDPVGEDLSGKVSLLGSADKKGKQTTLAKGRFYGSFSRDADGELALSGSDKGDDGSTGTLVASASAVALSDADEDGHVDGPPVLVVRSTSGNPTTTKKHGEILIDGVSIDYE